MYEGIDESNRKSVEHLLPRSAHEFMQLIGFEATLALVNEFGGTEIRFPLKEDGKASDFFAHLAEIVGYDNAKRLGAEFGRLDKKQIPRCLRAMTAIRNLEVVNLYDALLKSMSAPRASNEVARKYKMTSRNVEIIVNGKRNGALPS